MISSFDAVMALVRDLTDEERLQLLDALLDQMRSADAEWQAAWVAECQDRADAIDRSDMVLTEANAVMARYHTR